MSLETPQPKCKTKQAGKVSLLKNDVALFSHLYIVLQHWVSDMTTFFSHENHPFPPSLGKLRLGKKSDLLNIQNDPPLSVDVKVLQLCISTANDQYAD